MVVLGKPAQHKLYRKAKIMSKQLLAEIEALLAKGETELHGCWLPREAIERIPDFWRLCDEGSYDPLTFDAEFGVPANLKQENPVVVDGTYAFVYGNDGEQAFYFKLVCTLHVRHKHSSVAHAVGAFVQGELQACMREPSKLYVEDDETGARVKVTKFDFHEFERHLRGLLSDLVYLCAWGSKEPIDAETYTGRVVLVMVAAAPVGEYWPDNHEWQKCAQGFARIEAL